VKYGKINTTKKDNIIISIIYGVYAVPTIALFRDGKIIARHEGYMNREELEEFIDKELYANQDNHE
ncbi:MAG: thioredoxin family protein, partial [Sulfolobales archaeon]